MYFTGQTAPTGRDLLQSNMVLSQLDKPIYMNKYTSYGFLNILETMNIDFGYDCFLLF